MIMDLDSEISEGDGTDNDARAMSRLVPQEPIEETVTR